MNKDFPKCYTAKRPVPRGALRDHHAYIYHYVLYNKTLGNYCSHCGSQLETREPQTCPKCKIELEDKYFVNGSFCPRNHWQDTAYISYERIKDTFVKSFGIITTVLSNQKPHLEKTTIVEYQRDILHEGKVVEFVYGKPYGLTETKWHEGRFYDYFYGGMQKISRKTFYYGPKDVSKFVSNSCCQHSGVDLYLTPGSELKWFYLRHAVKFPEGNLLLANGFKQLHKSMFTGWNVDYRYFTMKNIKKYRIELRRMGDPSFFDFYWLVRCSSLGIKSYPELKKMFEDVNESVRIYTAEMFFALKKQSNLTSIKAAKTAITIRSNGLSDAYRDELKMRRELKIDDPKSLLFESVDNFNEVHKQTTLKYNLLKATKEAMKYEDAYKDMLPIFAKYQYSNERLGLSVVAPQTARDIAIEGNVLGHCVGTYVEQVINKKTTILFLRKNDSLDTPYGTIEYRGGIVIQCRGIGNESIKDPNAKEFLDAWVSIMSLKERLNKRKGL